MRERCNQCERDVKGVILHEKIDYIITIVFFKWLQ